jgi:tetratricopeptide (TPR) repeat protein
MSLSMSVVLVRARGFMFVGVVALAAMGSGCHWSAAGKNVNGAALHHQGRYQEAIQQFQLALQQNPASADAYYNMAASYHQLGKLQNDQQALAQAEQLYNQALNISPDHVDCHRALACLLVDTGRADKAFTLLERWAQRSPQVIDSHIELARLYEEFGDKENAIRNLEQAIAVRSDTHESARALSALARLREQSGDAYQALVNYNRSLQINPSQPAVAERIASLQRAMGGVQLPPTPSASGSTLTARAPFAQPVRY